MVKIFKASITLGLEQVAAREVATRVAERRRERGCMVALCNSGVNGVWQGVCHICISERGQGARSTTFQELSLKSSHRKSHRFASIRDKSNSKLSFLEQFRICGKDL